MICFEVDLNGKHVTTAGLPGWAVVSANISWVRSQDRASPGKSRYEELFVEVGGLDGNKPGGTHVQWLFRELVVGDDIRLRIREADEAASPKKRVRPILTTKRQQVAWLRKRIASLTEELNELTATSTTAGKMSARSRARSR